MLQVNASVVLRFGGDGTAVIVGRHNRDSADVFRLGEALPADDDSASRRWRAPPRPPGSTTGAARATSRASAPGYRSTAAAPIIVGGVLWGAVGIASEDTLPPDTENRLGAFCELVSLGRRLRAGALGPDRLARPPGQGRRRAAAAARAQPPRRRAVAARLGRARRCGPPARRSRAAPRPSPACSRTPAASWTSASPSCARSPAACTRRAQRARPGARVGRA